MHRILIANRGEIAIRIARAAADLGIGSVAVYPADDAECLHVRRADKAVLLPGSGASAYLDAQALVDAALAQGCDAIHPGYGFLSENAMFRRLCDTHGLAFAGPSAAVLDLFGDKGRARKLATDCHVPVPRGTPSGLTLAEAIIFQRSLGAGSALMVKASAGGGGRGMRLVPGDGDLAAAFSQCAAEAKAAFGDDSLYAEEVVPNARHIEVQLVSDGQRAITLHDRDCSIQRARQKLIEIAPAPGLNDAMRARLSDWSLAMASAAGLTGLATFEYLLPEHGDREPLFIEANPRLQVEHTVTEEVTGIDLVRLQLRLAAGETLAACGLDGAIPEPRGVAIQMRVNLERMHGDGRLASTAGTIIATYEAPDGPGIRVDGCAYGGYRTHGGFDPLLAKLIVHCPDGSEQSAGLRALRAAGEFRIEGAETNLPMLRSILEKADLAKGEDTLFVERNLATLTQRAEQLEGVCNTGSGVGPTRPEAPAGLREIVTPMPGAVVSLSAAPGDLVAPGAVLAIVEAMKMQHDVVAPVGGIIRHVTVGLAETVVEGWPLFHIDPDETVVGLDAGEPADPAGIRADLSSLYSRLAMTHDASRPHAVERRHAKGKRTARENLGDLFDEGAFSEFSALAIAAQRSRRDIEDLRRNTPADGVVTGVGEVGGRSCVALAYDFTVLAGTQGYFSHKKTDQALEFAEKAGLPVVFYTEGGGGRPGDVDMELLVASWLDTRTFTTYARMSGLAPRIAIASGRCFAGNAVFFGCSDITIATADANIGLAGPAMIEAGGLGSFSADEVGPASVQYANGTIDLLVDDEAAATAVAKTLLSLLQGETLPWTCADQRLLRQAVPDNRRRSYDMRTLMGTLADCDSFLELRGGYGKGMITGFLRIEGRALGVIANDPRHIGGAIDADGGEKAARFLQLCDSFDLPLLSLCDTPGFMVGPDSEKLATVRRASRLFVTAQALSVPIYGVVVRKGYGLGAQAMHGGDFAATAFTLAWPTAECGPMGLEGAVRLGFIKELAALPDDGARGAEFERLLAAMYERGSAIAIGEAIEVTAVIDPAETRQWLARALRDRPARADSAGRNRFIDTW